MPPGTGKTGGFAIFSAMVSTRSWNRAARRVVHGMPESATARSASSFVRIQAGGTRSAPITEMWTRCRTPAPDAARTGAGRLVVALGAARQVQHGPRAVDGGLDTLARQQVAGDVLDAVRGGAGVPGEDPHVVAGGARQRDHGGAEGARAAGDQDR